MITVYRSLSFFVWSGGKTPPDEQIHRYTSKHRNLLSRCACHMDLTINFHHYSLRGKFSRRWYNSVNSRAAHILFFQNPREASSRSRIFLNSLVYLCISVIVCVCIYVCHVSWPNEKRYRPEIWHTYSHWPYLKTFFFCFFDQITVTTASLEKLPCHVDFPHIS